MIRHEDTCTIKNIDTSVEVEAEILNFKLEDALTAVVVGNKIFMEYNKNTDLYVGKALGMEFSTTGPKYYEVKQGRY